MFLFPYCFVSTSPFFLFFFFIFIHLTTDIRVLFFLQLLIFLFLYLLTPFLIPSFLSLTSLVSPCCFVSSVSLSLPFLIYIHVLLFLQLRTFSFSNYLSFPPFILPFFFSFFSFSFNLIIYPSSFFSLDLLILFYHDLLPPFLLFLFFFFLTFSLFFFFIRLLTYTSFFSFNSFRYPLYIASLSSSFFSFSLSHFVAFSLLIRFPRCCCFFIVLFCFVSFRWPGDLPACLAQSSLVVRIAKLFRDLWRPFESVAYILLVCLWAVS